MKALKTNTDNQQLAFEKLSKLKVGALFMEMGTGKTKVALDLINSKKDKVGYILWICPFSIKAEIERERLKWYPQLDIDIVGCESIGSSDKVYLRVLKQVSNHNTFIVVDESLKIKNREAKRTQRILKLGEFATYKLILNGTPLSKNVLDLYTQMNFLSPKILKMPYNQFKNQYCEYYVRGRLKGLVKTQHNIEHLVSLIKPYIFDCELDIKANKQYKDFTYSTNTAEYEALKNELFDSIDLCRSSFDFFRIATILQQSYVGYKTNLLKEVIDGIHEKVIVFVRYVSSIPNGALSINGSLTQEERERALNQFRHESNVLYITYGCGAYGLNLQFCKYVIFAEHCFDYAQRIQAEARVYRIGQDYDVTYYNLWCDVGLENMIKQSLEKKANLLDEVKKEIERNGVAELKKIL